VGAGGGGVETRHQSQAGPVNSSRVPPIATIGGNPAHAGSLRPIQSPVHFAVVSSGGGGGFPIQFNDV
jgi:hypothetical protein